MMKKFTITMLCALLVCTSIQQNILAGAEAKMDESRQAQDYFTQTFGEKEVHQEINVKHFKDNIAIIKRLDTTQDKMILYSVFDRYIQGLIQREESDGKLLQQVLGEYEGELKDEMFQDAVSTFISKNGRKANPAEQSALERAMEKRFLDIHRLSSTAKLPYVKEMEHKYIEKAKTQAAKHSRRIFFEFVRDVLLKEIEEESYILEQTKPRKGWAKYRRYIVPALVLGAAFAGGLTTYRSWQKPREFGEYIKFLETYPGAGKAIPEMEQYLYEAVTTGKLVKYIYDKQQNKAVRQGDEKVEFDFEKNRYKKPIPDDLWFHLTAIMNRHKVNPSGPARNKVYHKLFTRFFEGEPDLIKKLTGATDSQ